MDNRQRTVDNGHLTGRPFWLIGFTLALLLLAFTLRLGQAAAAPLSLDEILTIRYCVPLSWLDILTCETRFHPLASVLAHLFSPQADHLFLMRWPAVVVGLLSLLLAYRLATDLFGWQVGLVALFLLSLSPIHLNYSAVVRGYVGLMATTCASLILLRRAWRHDRWRDWLGFAGVNFLGIQFHLYSVLALAIQLALLSLGYMFRYAAARYRKSGELELRLQLAKPLAILALLVLTYGPLVYVLYRYTAQVIQGESPWQDEFWSWRDGVWSLPADGQPFYDMLAMLGPLSPGGVGTYLYAIFWLLGLFALYRRRPALGLGATLWFLLPFPMIFVAMITIGRTFTAFTRYLIFMLPAYLIIVAVGLEAGLVGLLLWSKSPLAWRAVAGQFGIMMLLVGGGSLMVISTAWYWQRSSHAQWFQVAGRLADQLQPQDIVICEEHARGVPEPDRAKPYCMWMLTTLAPGLEAYTPRFESSTDFVAQYDYLQAQRQRLIKPGGVWVVLWQKVILDTSTFYEITAVAPYLLPTPDLQKLLPYPAWQFGTTTLLYVNSEESLLRNIYRAVELLLRVENRPADQARYYRSLAELAAVQGQAAQADTFLQQSRELIRLAGSDEWAFLKDTQQVIERLPADTRLSPAAQPVGNKLGTSLCLLAYEVSPEVIAAGQPLALKLYWQTLDFIDQDYTFFLYLEDETGAARGRLEFEPFERIYPTPWWWIGQQLAESQEFPLPADFPEGNYHVQLGSYAEQQGEENLLPLFQMVYQANQAGQVSWRLKDVARPTIDCP